MFTRQMLFSIGEGLTCNFMVLSSIVVTTIEDLICVERTAKGE